MNKVDNVIFARSNTKLYDEEFIDFEKSLNIKLPESFIEHYKIFNGGFPNANWSKGVEYVSPLSHFLSIKYGNDTIEKAQQELLLVDLLPFAINKIKGYFCIGIKNKIFGQIFYYRERPKVKDYKGTYDMNEIEFHCSDFQTFINNLYVDKFYGKVFNPKLGWIDDF